MGGPAPTIQEPNGKPAAHSSSDTKITPSRDSSKSSTGKLRRKTAPSNQQTQESKMQQLSQPVERASSSAGLVDRHASATINDPGNDNGGTRTPVYGTNAAAQGRRPLAEAGANGNDAHERSVDPMPTASSTATVARVKSVVASAEASPGTVPDTPPCDVVTPLSAVSPLPTSALDASEQPLDDALEAAKLKIMSMVHVLHAVIYATQVFMVGFPVTLILLIQCQHSLRVSHYGYAGI